MTTNTGRNTGYGSLSANGNTDEIQVRGKVTLAAIGTFGSGTLTWQWLGLDGTWRGIFDGTTALAPTANAMYNVDFANDTKIRGVLAGSTSPSLYWEVKSNPHNR